MFDTNIRDKVEEYKAKLSTKGITWKTLDYGFGLVALKKKDEAIWIAQVFRAERDGYEGYRIMAKETFEELFGK